MDAPEYPQSIHRPMHGSESLMIQGFPIFHPMLRELLRKHEHPMLQNLGGNAFPGIVVQALLCSFLFSVDFSEIDDDAIACDHDAAVAAMSLLSTFAPIRPER